MCKMAESRYKAGVAAETVRKPLQAAADAAKQWFLSKTDEKSREQYDGRGKLGDGRNGAVYVYYSKLGKALYVGQTGRAVKSRKHDQTSPHKMTDWWDEKKGWQTMRFVQLADEMDRLTLEFLLILALEPEYNTSPKYKEISKFLPDL